MTLHHTHASPATPHGQLEDVPATFSLDGDYRTWRQIRLESLTLGPGISPGRSYCIAWLGADEVSRMERVEGEALAERIRAGDYRDGEAA